jgi:germination protein M
MRRFVPVILMVTACMMLLLPGCETKQDVFQEETAKETKDDTADVRAVLYYQDETGYIIPVMRELPWVEGIGKAALNKLTATETNTSELAASGLQAVLPADISFDLDIREGLATLDVRGQLNPPDAAQESSMLAAMVNTLTGFPTVDQVQLLVNGRKSATLPKGTDISRPLANIPLNVEPVPEGAASKDMYKLDLFFISKSGKYLVPVTRLVAQKPDAETAMKELLKGPADTGKLTAVFPAGTRLLDIKYDTGDYIQLNFSKELLALKDDPEKEKMALKAIMLTVGKYDKGQSIVIKVEGNDYLPGGSTDVVTTFVNEFQ